MLFVYFNAQPHYNPVTDGITCYTRAVCLHEVGHKADRHLGDVARSPEYAHAIDVYRLMLWEYPKTRNEMSYDFFTYPKLGSIFRITTNPLMYSTWLGGWGGYLELYADVVMWSDGQEENCPPQLRGWYDWNFIGDEMEKLGYGR
jgi:hypothetical protein